MILLLAFLQLLPAVPARADWSCVTREGRLNTCASPSRCQKYFPACAAAGPVDDLECADPRCQSSTPEEKPPPPSKPPSAPAPPAPPKRLTRPGELAPPAAPTLQARAEKKLEEVRALVHAPHAEPVLSKTRGASGLSPDQEARLFGAPSEPALSAAEHARLVTELAADAELRNELRRQLASRSSGEHAYDRASAKALNAALAEAEGGVKSEDHVKPLTPGEAFGVDKQ